tara:strand:+ start:279 stop:401 length:123 start_codon:yes stop_codon:yes gene_type:complete
VTKTSKLLIFEKLKINEAMAINKKKGKNKKYNFDFKPIVL